MRLKPIATPRLYQRIATELVRLIDSGSFKPGERLPAERELAVQLGVSRSSLREALSSLEMAGRVDIRLGSGVYVLTAGRRKARPVVAAQTAPFDVLRARLLIEPEAAALAARHADTTQIKTLERIFARLAAAMRADKALPEADREFHVAIASAGGNTAIEMVVASLWAQWIHPLNARMAELFVTRGHKHDSIEEHRAVLAAIRERDPAAARLAMRRHLASVGRQRMSLPREAGR